jgi:hypothetical protein
MRCYGRSRSHTHSHIQILHDHSHRSLLARVLALPLSTIASSDDYFELCNIFPAGKQRVKEDPANLPSGHASGAMRRG